MQALIRLFIEVALHRKGPQDMPASGIVFALVLAAYLAIGAAVVYFALSVAMFRRYFPVE